MNHVPHNLLIGTAFNAFRKKHMSLRHTRLCTGRFYLLLREGLRLLIYIYECRGHQGVRAS